MERILRTNTHQKPSVAKRNEREHWKAIWEDIIRWHRKGKEIYNGFFFLQKSQKESPKYTRNGEKMKIVLQISVRKNYEKEHDIKNFAHQKKPSRGWKSNLWNGREYTRNSCNSMAEIQMTLLKVDKEPK